VVAAGKVSPVGTLVGASSSIAMEAEASVGGVTGSKVDLAEVIAVLKRCARKPRSVGPEAWHDLRARRWDSAISKWASVGSAWMFTMEMYVNIYHQSEL
jgi:hypothetical protein